LPAAVPDALREVDVLVVADADADAWASALPGERARHALLDGEAPTGRPGDRIGLVGWSAEEVGRIAAARAATAPESAFTWFEHEEAAWGLWQGPTASPVARRVRVAEPLARADDVAGLGLLVVGQPDPVTVELAALAAARGTAVARLGSHAVEAAISAPVEPPSSVDSPWTLDVATGAAAVAELLAGKRTVTPR
jgi:hypothetical protein